jgi:hypothetical protein
VSRRPTFKPSLAETKRQNQAAMDFYRALSPREDAPRIDVGAKPKQERGPIDKANGEGPVLAAVGEYLCWHPGVVLVVRLNSGMARNENDAPIWFHKLMKVHGEVARNFVMLDYLFAMNTGRLGLMECKRPDWTGPSVNGRSTTAERERMQARMIAFARRQGWLSGFVRSVEEARAVIEGQA